ncbi:MAG: hydantoinase/oxoprolinase family protein [Acidobacteriia bacterium]|nr:hydantoinase/oxoprolinase family protein [Terriglobia bacterium]
MLTVDIDIGGTLTDGIFTDGGKIVCAKVDTTPHDLTICLFDCLTQGAVQLGYSDVDLFLEKVDLIRWSTTITSNVLAELRGPRIGLLISPGHEKNIYSKDARSVVMGRILSERDVIGIDPAASDAEVMNAVRSLLETGVRRICVSFEGAHRNPELEIRIKKIVGQQYPDHFLGSVPVLAGSDSSKSYDDMTRTDCALINAYTHGALAATLFKAEDDLRDAHKYDGTFLVSHINGGVSGIAKTKAIDTIESGPILGIHGSAHLAALYGVKDVVALDVGGTTAKVSVLRNSAPVQIKPSDFFGIPVEISLPYLRSIALGGGSIVRPAAGKGKGKDSPVTLGPESMGSYPGPACYTLGGEEPTLTDAFVTAGLINPDYFLGGAKSISKDAARQAIEQRVATPLKKTPEEVSCAIIERAYEMVAEMIAAAGKELHQDFAKHALFAYGGNGGLIACGVAEKAGLREVYFFNLGPVFSAFGSSVSDISHLYERALHVTALDEAGVQRVFDAFHDCKAEGTRDLLGEGIKPQGIEYSVELEISRAGKPFETLACSPLAFTNAAALKTSLEDSVGGAKKTFAIGLIRVRIKKPMPKPALAKKQDRGASASAALKGQRAVAWGSKKGEAQLYTWEKLEPGNKVEGCAILEGANSTFFVPEGWTLVMDQHGNAKLTRS